MVSFQPQGPCALEFIVFITSYVPRQTALLPRTEKKKALKWGEGGRRQVGQHQLRPAVKTLQKHGLNIRMLPTREVLTCLKCVVKTGFLGLLLSLGTGNTTEKPSWSHAFGGELQSCRQDKELGLLFLSCWVSSRVSLPLQQQQGQTVWQHLSFCHPYSPEDGAWLCEVTDPSSLTRWA